MTRIRLTSRNGLTTTLRVTESVAKRLQNRVEPGEWSLVDEINDEIGRWLDSKYSIYNRPLYLSPAQCRRLFYFPFGTWDDFYKAEVL